MKKLKNGKEFLEELSKVPIMSAVCEKVGLSRQTIYRWIKECPGFKKRYETALKRGRNSVNDLAEGKLIANLKRGDSRGIEFWLKHNHKNYKIKNVVDDEEEKDELTEVKIVTITAKEEIETLKQLEKEIKEREERLLKMELD
jgi:hypothetical protein